MKLNSKILWNKPANWPIIKPGQLHGELDKNGAGACHVIQEGEKLEMYYWGRGIEGNVILSAESSLAHPTKWRPCGAILLEPEPDNPFYCNGPSFPFVVKINDKLWYMYFVGWGRPREDKKLPNTTCLAISEDAGKTWRYYKDNPIIKLEKDFEKEATGSVSVLKIKDELWMYYTSIGTYFKKPEGVRTGHGDIIPRIGIALARSKDGINWKKEDQLVLAPRFFDANPYEYINSKPFVIKEEDGLWRMFFSSFGFAYRIQEAQSTDGIHWQHVTKEADSYLGIGDKGCFDDVQRSYACVIKEGELYHMWYTGNGFGNTGIGYTTGVLK